MLTFGSQSGFALTRTVKSWQFWHAGADSGWQCPEKHTCITGFSTSCHVSLAGNALNPKLWQKVMLAVQEDPMAKVKSWF